MAHRILITGGSGYLGGTLLARWKEAQLPSYAKLFALVRTDEQASAVKQYGAEPLTIDLQSSIIQSTILSHKITIVYHLIDAWGSHTEDFIKGLAQVKKETGQDVHFLFTTGAKIFSSHAGAPTDGPLLDTDPGLYEIQKGQVPRFDLMGPAVRANCTVIDTAEAYGVKSYIFAPCIVYGQGEGFGNKISIQTVAIVRAARALGRVYSVDDGRPTWPVCHVIDNTDLYLEILRGILEGRDVGHGKNGFFLASSGSVAWDDIYAAMAKALEKRKLIDKASVERADKTILERMGEALSCSKELVPVQLGGL